MSVPLSRAERLLHQATNLLNLVPWLARKAAAALRRPDSVAQAERERLAERLEEKAAQIEAWARRFSGL